MTWVMWANGAPAPTSPGSQALETNGGGVPPPPAVVVVGVVLDVLVVLVVGWVTVCVTVCVTVVVDAGTLIVCASVVTTPAPSVLASRITMWHGAEQDEVVDAAIAR